MYGTKSTPFDALAEIAGRTDPDGMRDLAIRALAGAQAPALISKREAAIMHLTLADADTPETYRSWRRHWDAQIDAMAFETHGGDCMRQPGPCPRCKAEEAYAFAPVYQLGIALGIAQTRERNLDREIDAPGFLDRRGGTLMHLALQDVDEPLDYWRWHDHWSRRLTATFAEPHGGDCTDVPITCMRCLVDEAHAMAAVYQTAAEIALDRKT